MNNPFASYLPLLIMVWAILFSPLQPLYGAPGRIQDEGRAPIPFDWPAAQWEATGAQGLRGTTSTPPQPMVTLADMLEALNPGYSIEIAAIRQKALDGDIDGALADYLAWRRTQAVTLGRAHPLRDLAEEALDDELRARSLEIADALVEERRLIPFFVGWSEEPVNIDPFDWEQLRTDDSAAWGDAQRGYFWNDLGRAWQLIGDEAYFELFYDSFSQFMLAYPPREPIWPDGTETPYPIDWSDYPYNDITWAPLTVGIRLQDTLPGATAYFLNAEGMTPERYGWMVAAVLQHTRFLVDYATPTNNWGTIEQGGLAVSAMMWPEFTESTDWVEQVDNRLDLILPEQFLADGAQHELSPHYHCVAIRNLWLATEMYQQLNAEDPIRADLLQTLERGIDYAQRLQRPDQTEPLLGDSVGILPMRQGFYADEWRDSGGLMTGLRYFDRPDWEYLAGTSSDGVPSLDHWFPESGRAVLRTGWDSDALYLGFDVGQLGREHHHEDGLSLLLETAGQRWLVDTGRGAPYAGSFGRATYYQNSAGHSTARPVTRSQFRRSTIPYSELGSPENTLNPHIYLEGEQFAYMRGIYDDGYQAWPSNGPQPEDGLPSQLLEPNHYRALFYMRETGKVWVFDHLTSPDDLEWEIFWHLDAEISTDGEPGGARGQKYLAVKDSATTSPRERMNFTLFPLHQVDWAAPLPQVIVGRSEPTPMGFIQDDWAPPRPISSLVQRWPAYQSSFQAALFEPYHPDLYQKPTNDAVIYYADNNMMMYLSEGDVYYHLLFNPERRIFSYADVETDAEFAALKYARLSDGDRVVRWFAAEASYLNAAGKVLLPAQQERTTREEAVAINSYIFSVH